jgi:hypothetical protein
MSGKIVIREMVRSDCAVIAAAFSAQGWNKPLSQYLHYWQESCENKRVILIAEYEGQFAGYVTIVWESDYPPFHEAGIPEIMDFNVLIKFRRRKIGAALMDEAENRIAGRSSSAGLGVGMERGYGAAQIMYVKRGYIPDGRGIFFDGHFPKYGEQVMVNDDLVLYFSKQVIQG